MEEGGQPARLARYEANAKELLSGMADLGFSTYLSSDKQGCIISTFRESSDAPLFCTCTANHRLYNIRRLTFLLSIFLASLHWLCWFASDVRKCSVCQLCRMILHGILMRSTRDWRHGGAVIYPGKLTNAECFRLGSIGAQLRMSRVLMWRRSLIWHTRNANRLLVVADTCWFWWSRLQIGRMRPADMRFVTSCIKDVLTELGVSLPVTQVAASDPSPMTEVNLVFRPRPYAFSAILL